MDVVWLKTQDWLHWWGMVRVRPWTHTVQGLTSSLCQAVWNISRSRKEVWYIGPKTQLETSFVILKKQGSLNCYQNNTNTYSLYLWSSYSWFIQNYKGNVCLVASIMSSEDAGWRWKMDCRKIIKFHRVIHWADRIYYIHLRHSKQENAINTEPKCMSVVKKMLHVLKVFMW